MRYDVLVDHINFHADPARGEDGAVWYLILGGPSETVVCPIHPGRKHHYERQAFARGGPTHRPGATAKQIADNEANIWGWGGNTSAPTILPSFLAAEGRPYRLHSHLRGGKLELCNDSTVTLSSERPCMLEPLTTSAGSGASSRRRRLRGGRR